MPSVAVWLLPLLVPLALEKRHWIAPLVVAGVFEGFILGTSPLGEWAPIGIMIPVSAIGSIILLLLYGGALAGCPVQSKADAKSDLEVGDLEAAV